jgi:hypothetical protein
MPRHHRSDIPVFPEPVRLGLEIPEDDIAFLILETPRSDDNRIAFPDPGPLLDLSLDPAHAGDTVDAPDADMICPEHLFSKGELFVIPLFRQPYADGRSAIRIYGIQVRLIIILFVKTHSTNYVL